MPISVNSDTKQSVHDAIEHPPGQIAAHRPGRSSRDEADKWLAPAKNRYARTYLEAFGRKRIAVQRVTDQRAMTERQHLNRPLAGASEDELRFSGKFSFTKPVSSFKIGRRMRSPARGNPVVAKPGAFTTDGAGCGTTSDLEWLSKAMPGRPRKSGRTNGKG